MPSFRKQRVPIHLHPIDLWAEGRSHIRGREGGTMAYPRCAQLDILCNQFIESYRDMIANDVHATLNPDVRDGSIDNIRDMIRAHKETCMLCKRIIQASKMQIVSTRDVA